MDKKPKEVSSDDWVTNEAVQKATQCLKHFYTKNTADLASKVLTAAAPHLNGVKRGTVRKPLQLPDAATEAAAEVLYSSEAENTDKASWKTINDRLRGIYREDAKLVLNAVALYLI